MKLGLYLMSQAKSNAIMLYVGACTDVRPIVHHYSFVPHVRDFVYVDGLPGSNYLPRFNTKDKLLCEFERRHALFAYSTFVNKHEIIADKYVLYDLLDGRHVHYFINTVDSDIVNENVPHQLASFLEKVTYFYASGLHRLKQFLKSCRC